MLVNGGEDGNGLRLVRDIKELCKRQWEALFEQHVFGEENRDADVLAIACLSKRSRDCTCLVSHQQLLGLF